jgi:hypothetical protein
VNQKVNYFLKRFSLHCLYRSCTIYGMFLLHTQLKLKVALCIRIIYMLTVVTVNYVNICCEF